MGIVEKLNKTCNRIQYFGDALMGDLNYETKTKNLNRLWMKKAIIFYFILLILFASLAIDIWGSWLNDYVEIIGRFVPMINGLLASNVKNKDLAAKYFSIMAIFLPIFVIWVVCEDDVVARCNYGRSRMRGGPLRVLGFVYVIGLPFLFFVIYLIFAAPFGFSEKPGTFGQTIFFLLLNSDVGLPFLGSIFGVCFSQSLIFACWIILFPFVALIKNK